MFSRSHCGHISVMIDRNSVESFQCTARSASVTSPVSCDQSTGASPIDACSSSLDNSRAEASAEAGGNVCPYSRA